MQYEYKPSFIRSFKSLRSVDIEEDVKLAVKKFIFAMNHPGMIPHGMGLRKLKDPYYEFRSGLGIRVVFRRQADLTEFVLVGNHDDIKRFLKVH